MATTTTKYFTAFKRRENLCIVNIYTEVEKVSHKNELFLFPVYPSYWGFGRGVELFIPGNPQRFNLCVFMTHHFGTFLKRINFSFWVMKNFFLLALFTFLVFTLTPQTDVSVFATFFETFYFISSQVSLLCLQTFSRQFFMSVFAVSTSDFSSEISWGCPKLLFCNFLLHYVMLISPDFYPKFLSQNLLMLRLFLSTCPLIFFKVFLFSKFPPDYLLFITFLQFIF